EQPSLTEGQQSRLVRSSRLAADSCRSLEVAIGFHQGRSGPPSLPRAAATRRGACEADKTPGDARARGLRVPQVGVRARELALDADELGGRLGPHRLLKYRTGSLECNAHTFRPRHRMQAMTPPLLVDEPAPKIRQLTLNRPEQLNTMTSELCEALHVELR